MRATGGAKLIVVDPRETPLARTADLHVPVRPGTDAAFFNGVLHVVAREGWLDDAFIAERTVGWEDVLAVARTYDPARAAEICGIDPDLIERTARMWGTAERAMAFHARGIEHQALGVENALSIINLVLATGQIGAEGKGYGTITGQGNGQGGREHGQKADQLPGARDIENPEHRRFISDYWGIDEAELPHAGVSAVELVHLMETGEVRGFLALCNNPYVSMPNATRIEACYEQLEFHVQIDFFLSETAARADVVLPCGTWAEEGGTTTNAEGRVTLRHKAAEPLGEARPDWWIIGRIAERDSASARSSRSARSRRSSRSCAAHRRAASRITAASPISDWRRRVACSGLCQARTTPARPVCSRSASSSPTAGRGSTPWNGARPPSPSTPNTRCA